MTSVTQPINLMRERPKTEYKHSHACHCCITYNECDSCLLTPSEIDALQKYIFKGWRL